MVKSGHTVVWSGAINLGLVHVPVKLTPCTRDKGIDLKLITQTPDGWKSVKRPYLTSDGEPVDNLELFHGYDTGSGWVALSKSDLDAIAAERDKRLQLDDFVPLHTVDRILYQRPYWVMPATIGDANYALLLAAMTEAKLAGVGRYVMRSKQYPVVVFPHDGILVVDHLYYANQVVEAPELNLPKPPRAAVKQAVAIIKSLAVDSFDPAKYTSDYDERLQALIEERATSGELVELVGEERREETPAAQVPDLMAGLQATLDAAAAAKAPKPKRKAKATA